MTYEIPQLEDKVVPAAQQLPPNSEYLKHLDISGRDGLIRLASNENTDRPSPDVERALTLSYLEANLSPPPVPQLALELAARHRLDPTQVLVTAGSTEVIDATLRTFVRAGEEVVLPAPSWPVCQRRLKALEARVIEVPLDSDDRRWYYDVTSYLDAMTPATKLVFVCTPNNPTGNTMELPDLRRLADTGIPLLIDAAYCDFDPGVDVVALVREYENV